ncbi:NUDIX domain-containing protein [Ensifer sp. ENS12]|uniref:NUDIX hydrolase n=1 Tax=Ensifer sp. ENS12 TaxID=2854774 RepID=UPI001C44B74B|nr:NUDIX domain-containing protein [Ensifer sp. ENS12]MBV7522580.1 NUDIX domain-containing protein [Ensifer sp. ENS12]
MRTILKVGLAVISEGKILLVRKRGGEHLILPGGKPEGDEEDIEALEREIWEELGCCVERDSLSYSGCFSDQAAGLNDTFVSVRLYIGVLTGAPQPLAEIEALDWHPIQDWDNPLLAPSLRNSILPRLAGSEARSFEESGKGLRELFN